MVTAHFKTVSLLSNSSSGYYVDVKLYYFMLTLEPFFLFSIYRGSQSKESTATTPQKNRFGIFEDQSDQPPPPQQQPASMPPPPPGGQDRNRGPTRGMSGRGSRGPSADSERQRALQVLIALQIAYKTPICARCYLSYKCICPKSSLVLL